MSQTLRDHIQQDLAARLQSGGLRPADLVLTRIAKEYGVSLTPVRQAVEVLVREGLLLKSANGRLSPAAANAAEKAGARAGGGPQGAGRAARPIEAPDKSQRLRDGLLREIVTLAVRPELTYLREEATAKRHGVGRTALRQALSQLAGRGLVEHIPRCGWRVRHLDERDLTAYLEVREVLELKALEAARGKLLEEDLQRMLRGNKPKGSQEQLDNDLHAYLIEKAGNPYIADFFRQHGAYYGALFDFAAPEVRVVARMAGQHRAILQALIAGDWEAAAEALAAHIRAQYPILVALLSRMG